MDTESFSTIAALVAVLANVLTLGLVALRLVSRNNANARSLLGEIGQYRLVLSATVATTCMLGSLYYSEIAGFTPCRYCWYQRWFMYPLPFIVLIGAVLLERKNITRRIVGWGALFGSTISMRHLYIQNWDDGSTSCSAEAPCSFKWVEEFGGVVSIPYMAMSGFLLIAALSLLTYFRNSPDVEDVVTDVEDKTQIKENQ